ncbi:MAG: UvrD-helicase domain-containing protein [Dehalococcoidales bacterium]|nr:UvrD-helicase domain-containing protein [Dehalococcoidales bacterium]
MYKNNLIIAAAGSGKTTYLVNEALKIKGKNVLVTTFTDANEEEIKKKFLFENRGIPDNVTVQTWFSFLIQHGAKPYQGGIYEERINGLSFISGQSTHYIEEANTEKYYFDNNHRIYSDKISCFAIKCNKISNGEVISRISKIYPHIFIDEVQDLAGYDLEFLTLLLESSCHLLLVCDPRQGTYSTSNSAKNKKYNKSSIVLFFNRPEVQKKIEIDEVSLVTNYRSNQKICDFANRIYPGFCATNSGQNITTGHDGIFLVREQNIDNYFAEYPSCMQLRYDVKEKRVKNNYGVLNFGISKGLSFDRVLVYPTNPILDWIKNNNSDLSPTSRSKFYVAVTRAKYSVGIVYNYRDDEIIEGTERYQPKTARV